MPSSIGGIGGLPQLPIDAEQGRRAVGDLVDQALRSAEGVTGSEGAFSTPAIGGSRPSSTPRIGGGGGPSFADTLVDALSQSRQLEQKSEETAAKFADGDPSVGIHETMIAAEKAAIAVRYSVTLKNKALEAYRELMNTPV